jgi:hypothetical protein
MDEPAGGQNMDWIHDELRDGIDNYDADLAKKYQAAYKTERFEMMKDISTSKKKVEEELKEYKKQFEVPEQEVKLIPYNYPEDI